MWRNPYLLDDALRDVDDAERGLLGDGVGAFLRARRRKNHGVSGEHV